ncbi:hypothetical protein RBH94_06010 [Aestuariibaculum sp. YM273]|uniref:hypothetical protein n=1 Tax=Aestuariibaculum sp. YM273 TaxID=3070659 RepID=UPI0027DD4AAB|nr:hypothetical protein [Aestuariibaculum sp. YM273]WMI66715.1 hypothetical protein RBH94_06010 [Aestuariibaculum sp. YM273]
MSKEVFNNSTIECLSAEIISRKILPSSFLEIEHVGRCFTYKCSRNSEATVKKELDPKEPFYNEHSLLDLGSKLECENMFVAINKKKPYKYTKINHTGRHKAQTFTSKEYTFAKISKQLSNIPLCDPPKEIVLIEKK